MTWRSPPKAFPKAFSTYPATESAKSNQDHLYLTENLEPKLFLPLFFHIRIFRDKMMLSYMLGIGVDQQQVKSLVFDFINIYVMSMYILNFRNPILNKNVSKVYW